MSQSPQPQHPAWSERLAAVSRPWLLRLHAMPRAVVLIGTIVLAVAGLLVPGPVGGVLLVLLGLLVLWLALLTWTAASAGGRVLRLAAAALVLGYGLAKVVGAV